MLDRGSCRLSHGYVSRGLSPAGGFPVPCQGTPSWLSGPCGCSRCGEEPWVLLTADWFPLSHRTGWGSCSFSGPHFGEAQHNSLALLSGLWRLHPGKWVSGLVSSTLLSGLYPRYSLEPQVCCPLCAFLGGLPTAALWPLAGFSSEAHPEERQGGGCGSLGGRHLPPVLSPPCGRSQMSGCRAPLVCVAFVCGGEPAQGHRGTVRQAAKAEPWGRPHLRVPSCRAQVSVGPWASRRGPPSHPPGPGCSAGHVVPGTPRTLTPTLLHPGLATVI